MQVAFVAGGCRHSQYHKVLGALGMKSFGHKMFDETVKRMSMPVLELPCDQCKEAKDDMSKQQTGLFKPNLMTHK